MSLFDIAERSFVVTGGAGYLGLHICAGLANAGANVLCLSSRVADLTGLTRVDIDSVVCDVSRETEFEPLVARFAEVHGRLDGLVNAAMRAPRGIDLDMPKEEFSGALDSILTQYFTCSRVARRYMGKGGSIVNLTSLWGLRSPEPAVYLDLRNEPSLAMGAAAGGILGLTRYMAVVLAGYDPPIRVNALVPGWFPKRRGPNRPDYMHKVVSRVPLGRIGQPEDLVGAAIYLLSDASAYMTGQQIVVDGGFSVQ